MTSIADGADPCDPVAGQAMTGQGKRQSQEPDPEQVQKQASEQAEGLARDAQLPAVRDLHARKVREGFWPKLRKVAARVPFAQELIAVWYAARDPATPAGAKGTMMAALFYFVLPTDLVPDIFMAVGFVDDGAVLAALVGLVARYVTNTHRERARRWLDHGKAE